MFKLAYPFDGTFIITQTYAQHVTRAKAMGCCSTPGSGCGCYYYGGIDYGTPNGTPIKAALDGVVKEARKDTSGYGTHVRVHHDNGYMTIYGHLMSYAVFEGQEIATGQVIGMSDNTGNSTGPHLHFELRDPNGVAVDPQPFLDYPGQPVPPEPPSGEYPAFPELPRARSLVNLNVRTGPGTSYNRLYALSVGEQFGVIGVVELGADRWLQIGHKEWCAMVWQGNTYVEWI